MFKNHKIIKIFQRENYEKNRSEIFVTNLKEKSEKIAAVYIRSTRSTNHYDCNINFLFGKLIFNEELAINNFSFLAAMMLAYQPVKSTKVNVAIGQGLAAANRIIPIIDIENQIKENLNSKSLDLTDGNIIFDNVNFSYKSNLENKVLKNVL